ncbi:MAG: WecB/TagA/CpsF family glycosyltransferase [Spirochaetales bacterium]|nr:WecB/TagA/CpsF family glycosyltransferase [Spirochaetales bacterium]MCF7938697.1 WecB/TagA/CpsF family glycosyltransferase [Spirochaetales bacterium]
MGTEELLLKKTRIHVLGVPLDVLKEDDIESVIIDMAEGGKLHQIVMLNRWDLMRGRRDKDFGSCLHESTLVLPVSYSLCRAASFLGKTRPERYLPYDFIIRILTILENHGKSVYLIGAKKRELNIAADRLRQTFPGLRIVGSHEGFYPRHRENDIITAMKKASPALILASRGLKGKEKWLYHHRSQLGSGIAIWDRDVFDIFAARKKRIKRSLFERHLEAAPEFFRKPWRILRFFVYLWYWILLLVNRFKKG